MFFSTSMAAVQITTRSPSVVHPCCATPCGRNSYILSQKTLEISLNIKEISRFICKRQRLHSYFEIWFMSSPSRTQLTKYSSSEELQVNALNEWTIGITCKSSLTMKSAWNGLLYRLSRVCLRDQLSGRYYLSSSSAICHCMSQIRMLIFMLMANLDSIFRFQKRAARVILNAPVNSRSVDLFNTLNWIRPFYRDSHIKQSCTHLQET